MVIFRHKSIFKGQQFHFCLIYFGLTRSLCERVDLSLETCHKWHVSSEWVKIE